MQVVKIIKTKACFDNSCQMVLLHRTGCSWFVKMICWCSLCFKSVIWSSSVWDCWLNLLYWLFPETPTRKRGVNQQNMSVWARISQWLAAPPERLSRCQELVELVTACPLKPGVILREYKDISDLRIITQQSGIPEAEFPFILH